MKTECNTPGQQVQSYSSMESYEPFTDYDCSSSTIEDQIIQKEKIELVYHSISKLDERLQVPMFLCFRGCSDQEIAEILKMNIVKVQGRLNSARKDLKVYLKGHGYV